MKKKCLEKQKEKLEMKSCFFQIVYCGFSDDDQMMTCPPPSGGGANDVILTDSLIDNLQNT